MKKSSYDCCAAPRRQRADNASAGEQRRTGGDGDGQALSAHAMSRGVDPEEAEEIGRRRPRDRLHRHAAQPRDLGGDVRHVGRLVALAAVRHRREVGRVGLDQQPVERHAARDVLQRRARS